MVPRAGAGWTLSVALALLAAAMAGCSDPTDAAQPTSPAHAGSIAGVVVDQAIRPVAGATASIPALPDVVAQATTADGTFRFDGLRPGLHVVHVAKPGYLATVVQAVATEDKEPDYVRVVLEPLAETKPYVVLESFEGFLDCGVGAAPLFGFTFACQQTAGAGLAALCNGAPPVPPTGVCLDETDPYVHSLARGNMSMAQTELVWEPSSGGPSELLFVQYVFDASDQIVAGAGTAAGPSYLVSRLNGTILAEHDLRGVNHLGFYVSVGSTQTASVVVQQAYRLFHTAAYYFELDIEWAFVDDGAPLVPPTCTTCLANA